MRHKSPLQAIKEKCKEDCSAGDRKSWVDCTIEKCALFSFRFGKNPYHKSASAKSKRSIKEKPVIFSKLEPSTAEKQEKLI